MADLYSVIPGMQPTQQEVLEAELLAKQILESKFPNMDLREGTGVRDLVLRPTATLLAMIKKATDYYFTQNDLLSVNDATPAAVVDSIMSNLFISRKPGTKSVVNARLFFARAKNTSVSSNTFFSTDNVSKFFPAMTINVVSQSMTLDPYSNEYYVDIELTAEQEGKAYNISSGSLLYFSSFDPYFLRAEINYLVSASITTETNSQFITRAKSSVSTRNMINTPSIDFVLRDTFNYLSHVLPIGMGDTEMIRDMILAVLPTNPARQITAMTVVSGNITATLSNHRFNSGQVVVMSGCSNTNFNTSFTITYIDESTFSFVLPLTTTVPTTLPQVRSSDLPVRTHIGGCTDIYCADQTSSNIVQVTTDGFGQAVVTGPVFNIARSQVSGGNSQDSIPFQNNVTVGFTSVGVTPNLTTGVALYTLTAPSHPFTVGDSLYISGFSQTRPIYSINCSGITATGTSTSHGYVVGDVITVAGVIPVDYNGTYQVTAVTASTFSYVMLANVALPGNCTAATVELNTINGTQIVTTTTLNSVSFSSRNPNTLTTGTGSVTSPVKYFVRNPNTETRPIASVGRDQLTHDVLIGLPKHGYVAGRRVVLSGFTPSGYNGGWVIKSVTNQDNFVVSVPSMALNTTVITTNIPQCTSVIPTQDTGFSTRQSLVIDFGAAYAYRTASFNMQSFLYLDSIQSFLDNANTRVICGDYLARGFNLFALDFAISSYLPGGLNQGLVASSINTYVASLLPGDPFVVTELIAVMRASGVIDIKLPITVGYRRFTRELDYYLYSDIGVITDVLDPNDRTTLFMVNSINVASEALPTAMIPTVR